jgi:hypothetical protein
MPIFDLMFTNPLGRNSQLVNTFPALHAVIEKLYDRIFRFSAKQDWR